MQLIYADLKKPFIAVTAQLSFIVGVLFIYFSYPVTYVKLIAEDNWGEYTTFIAFLCTSLFLAICVAHSQEKKHYIWSILLASGAFLVAMEEISWGQRIIGIPTPGALLQINFQKEITLHNISALSPGSLTYLVVSIGLILYGVVFPALVIAFSRVKFIFEYIHFPLPKLYLAPFFIAASFFLSFSPLPKGDEIGEMFLGLSIGCLAIDIAVTEVKFWEGEKQHLYRAFFVFFIFLALWFVFSYFVGPWLIVSSYNNESLLTFNNIISDQRPLDHYLHVWQRMRIRILSVAIIFLLISLTFILTVKRKGGAVAQTSPSWMQSFSIPIFLVGALSIGLLLSNIAGSPSSFHNRLIEFANSKLINKESYQQAEKIISYLEKNSIVSDTDLLIIKGRLYAKSGRSLDAQKFLNQALQIELARYAKKQNNSVQAQLIATLYSLLGNNDRSASYWNEAIVLSERELDRVDSKKKRFNVLYLKAMAYQEMGNNRLALSELLNASEYAVDAYLRKKLEGSISSNLCDCRIDDVAYKAVSWKKIEKMKQAVSNESLVTINQ